MNRHRLHGAALAGWLCLLPLPIAAQSLSLSPAVVSLRGEAGQSTRQTISLTNGTSMALAFEMEARDVVVRDGGRAFVRAGETPGSIAATAVFSTRTVSLEPGQSRSVDVTLTLPPGAAPRAVVVLFRGTTRIAGDGGAGATASIGSLLTFALSDQVSVAASELAVRPQTASRNLAIEQQFANDGPEPLVLKGMTVILDAAGALVGRIPSRPHRLLPGERALLSAEYAGELAGGSYRAISTFDYEGRAVSSTAEFSVR